MLTWTPYFLAAMVLWAGWAKGAGETVTVSAAVSLKEALSEIAKSYEKETGEAVRLNMGGSGQLMEQIKNGAPVDLFVSAGPGQVEELERAHRVVDGTRRVVARNKLVLVVPADRRGGGGGGDGVVAAFEDLAKAGVARVAVGKPGAVPAGDYATEVFDHLGITRTVKGKLVYGANVRQVLDYVARGEVDAGVVYATDAMEAGDKVKVVAQAPPGSHRPIEYVGVVIKGGREAAGGKLLEYLGGEGARDVLARRGFAAPKGG